MLFQSKTKTRVFIDQRKQLTDSEKLSYDEVLFPDMPRDKTFSNGSRAHFKTYNQKQSAFKKISFDTR